MPLMQIYHAILLRWIRRACFRDERFAPAFILLCEIALEKRASSEKPIEPSTSSMCSSFFDFDSNRTRSGHLHSCAQESRTMFKTAQKARLYKRGQRTPSSINNVVLQTD